MKRILSAVLGLGFCLACLVACDNGTSSIRDEDSVVIADSYFTDSRDNNRYKIVDLGGVVWMAENLRYADSSENKSLKGNSWCPDGDEAKCKTLGRLYSWSAIRDIDSEFNIHESNMGLKNLQGICPDGWRLPLQEDWISLYKYVDKYNGSENVAVSLMSATGWDSRIWGGGSDRFGFNGSAAGRKNNDGGFMASGLYGYYWTATEIDGPTAYGWTINGDDDILDSGLYYKEHGMSVRCIVDSYEHIEWKGAVPESKFGVHEETIDGKTYETVLMGDDTWMTKNSDVRTEQSRCYSDQDDQCEVFGALYLFEDAMENACPFGWRIPSANEWNDLVKVVDSFKDLITEYDWTYVNGYDTYSFSALPGGIYESHNYSDKGRVGYFWTSEGYVISFDSLYENFDILFKNSDTMASVRCIKGFAEPSNW